MAYADDYLYNALLTILDTEATRLDICDTEPTTFTEATETYTLGFKAGITVSPPIAHDPTGMEVTVSAITDGEVTADGTAGFYAISDTVNSRLLVARALSSTQAVADGNVFSTPAFKIYIPAPI